MYAMSVGKFTVIAMLVRSGIAVIVLLVVIGASRAAAQI